MKLFIFLGGFFALCLWVNAALHHLTTDPTPDPMTAPAPNRLTDAIAEVESSFGLRMHQNQCNGWHMMSFAAWSDVNEFRASHNKPTYPYAKCYDYQISSEYCRDYLGIQQRHLSTLLHKTPTLRQVLAAYRLGVKGLQRLDFNTESVNAYISAIEKQLP